MKKKPPLRTPKKKPGLIVNDMTLARARGKPHKAYEPFAFAQHPPGVVPAGSPTLAMDDALCDVANWAQNAIGSIYADGQAFLGYPELSLMAQRPEYRRMSEIIATEMTRAWIKLQATGDDDKSDKIKKINAALKRLKVQDAFRKLAMLDGFFGRAHLYLDFGTTDDRDELKTPIGNGVDRISKSKIGKGALKAVRVVEPIWCYPSNYNSNDPLRSDWYKPSMWFVQGKEIHASRLLTFIGREVPDILKPAYSFGGLSLSQMAKPYVDNWLRTRQSVSDIVHSFSVFVLMTDMQTQLQDGGDNLFNRIDLFNSLRDNRGVMALNKDSEEFKNVSASLATLDALQAQSQEQQASVTGIPLVKFFGIQPAGLNASSEGELESFYAWIHAQQELLFNTNLTTVINFVQLSEFGEVDPEITHEYEKLWTVDELDAANVRKLDAETGQILIDAGAISQLEERTRIASAPDTLYPGLDVEDVPDLRSEEMSGLEPMGGRPDPELTDKKAA